MYDVITSGREAPLSTLLFVLRNGRFPLVRERVNVITVRIFFVCFREDQKGCFASCEKVKEPHY